MIRTLNNNSSNNSNILGSVRGSSVSCSICDDVTQSLSNSKYMDEANNPYFDVVDIDDEDNDLRNDSRNGLQSS